MPNNDDVSAPFDLSDIEALDEAVMEIHHNGRPVGWHWTFAGPGHPRTIAQRERILREEMATRRQKEQAQVNGKKWKAPERRNEDVIAENVVYVLERLLGWSAVSLNGQNYPFSTEAARAILSDPKKGSLLQQAIDFLLDDNSFTKRSPQT